MSQHVLYKIISRTLTSRWIVTARSISVMRPSITDKVTATSFVNSLSQSERAHLQQSLNEVNGVLATSPTLTRKLLWTETMYSSIPFLGFGFLDNSIMLCAGEYIDMTVGAALGISTLAAAAFGNLISDVAGIGMAGTVERHIKRVLGRSSVLTPVQREMSRTHYYVFFGRCVGICVGCLLGMWPLLLYRGGKEEDEESEQIQSEEKS